MIRRVRTEKLDLIAATTRRGVERRQTLWQGTGLDMDTLVGASGSWNPCLVYWPACQAGLACLRGIAYRGNGKLAGTSITSG